MKHIIMRKKMSKLYQDANGNDLKDHIKLGSTYKSHQTTRYTNVVLGENNIASVRNSHGEYIECKKELPQLYAHLEECCGCGACYSVCPNSIDTIDNNTKNIRKTYNDLEKEDSSIGTISMLTDEYGFLYPVIDASTCIRCYKCIKVCPLKKDNDGCEIAKPF